MSSKANTFLDQYLGQDFLESLVKTELWKPGTKSVTDIDDMRIGLKIVPRTVMALLVRELTPMQIGETKEINLAGLSSASHVSVKQFALMRVTKHERDVYSGEIEEDNKKLTEFKFRSIPGVGLVIMSAFELYQFDEIEKDNFVEKESDLKLQRMIDERLSLHELIGKVVDNKIMEREAIHKLVLSKLTEAVHSGASEASEPKFQEPVKVEKKVRPLEDFLQKRKAPKEFAFQLAKGESVACPDCGNNVFDGKVFSACVCYGDAGKVFLKKTEDGFKIRFSKNWEVENIEMLLELLRKKNK